MQSLPQQQNDVNAEAMASLVEKCQRLCTRAESTIKKLPAESQSFLARNLEDSLQHLDLILNALDEDGNHDGEKAQRFLRRLTRGLSGQAKKGSGGKKSKKQKRDLRIPTQGLQGNSWTISLPELVGFLAFGRKTGVLWVDSSSENFLLGLVDGELMHASSDGTPEGSRMGETLVGLGYLTRRQLERFLSEREEESGLTGEALLKGGLISADELQTVLAHQARQLFVRLIETKNAMFRFREGMEVAVAYQVSLNIPQLLLESARVQDELTKAGHLEKIVGDPEQDVQGTPEDWQSWNQEMLSELAAVVLDTGEGDGPSAAGAGESEGDEQQDRSGDAAA